MKASDKEILRLALADHAFQEADALATHIQELNLSPDSHLLNGLLAGIIVSYCRPFMSASGLGTLPKTMLDFRNEKSGPDLLSAHNSIFEARNKSSAHFDRIFWEEQHAVGLVARSLSEVHVKLNDDKAEIAVFSHRLNTNNLDWFRFLFDLQRRRVLARLSAIAVELRDEGKRGAFVFKAK